MWWHHQGPEEPEKLTFTFFAGNFTGVGALGHPESWGTESTKEGTGINNDPNKGMIDFCFGDDEEAGGLKYGVSEWAPEHGFFVSNVLDDVGGDPGGDGERKINEENGSLAKIFVAVVVIKFGDHVLKRVVRGEHDHEADSQIGHPKILLTFR